MNPFTQCPRCGHVLSQPAPACPVCGCLLGPLPPVEGKLLRNGDFRVIRRLDRGGMASLYLAEATSTGGLRAVKELRSPPNRKARATAEAMFHEEARLLSRLSREHPAIPRYYDSFMDSGSFYLVLEFVPGQNLQQYLMDRGGSLPVPEVIDYLRQVVDVLATIHSLHPDPIIHGDIKPSNLVRRPDGQVALVDFGLARATVRMPAYVPSRSSAFGSPGYTPMEQWEGHPGPASDIFALGATMHHLITGRNPRAAFTNLAKVNLAELSTLTNFPPITTLMPEVPPMLDTIIMQMVRRRAAERPTARDLKARLSRLDAVLSPQAFGENVETRE
jgi:serine/threonine protein kinase